MKAYLVLQDGVFFEGKTLDSQIDFPEKAGEVVFNTSHSGYEEVASDPSYFSQIIVMTAPMMGNYGLNKKNWESSEIWIQGFVCVQMQNSQRESSWAQCLVDHQVPVLTEVDTRSLVLKLRNQGTPWGAIVKADSATQAKEKAFILIEKQKSKDLDWVHQCSRQKAEERIGKIANGPQVAVLDFGCKENILRELLNRCSKIKIFPSRTEAAVIQEWKPDSLLLTNGPGDPASVLKAPETIRHFVGQIPVFGICMGHQVLALAIGAKTYKLKFGHRGANHPIKDELLNKIYISSQNHGYAVVPETLPTDVHVTQRNLNDGTVAGFYSKKLNFLGIQYHPESHPGPHEAEKLFDFFIHNMHQNEPISVKNKNSENKIAGPLC